MTEKQRRYKFGDYILRERKGRYYVYKLENVNGEVKERYVGPLTDVVETYEKLKNSSGGVGVPPTTDPPGFEPGTAGSGGLRSILAKLRVLFNFHILVNESIPRTLRPFLSTVSTPFTKLSLVILFPSSGSCITLSLSYHTLKTSLNCLR